MTNQERDTFIREKLNQGVSLSDVQKLLDSELGIKLTYFELRMIVSTLEVDWNKQEKKHTPAIPAAPKPSPAAPQPGAPAEEAPLEDEDLDEETEEDETEGDEDTGDGSDGATSSTVVTLDETPLRGAVMSGHVTFASGASGKWVFSRMGQLGLSELDEGSAQPTQEDLMLFQQELQAVMARRHQEMQKRAFDGRTQVEVSPLVKPGCELNGTVTFASGAKGEWFISQGQLDYELEEGSAKPTAEDLSLFQVVLSKKLQEKGMA